MFGYIRLAIGIIIFAFLFWLIMKSKIVRKRKFYVFSGIVAFGVVVALSFLPIENLFITFDSPQAVYRYMSNEKLNDEIVVEGENCDLLINSISSSTSEKKREIFFVPKTSDGYKLYRPFASSLKVYIEDGFSFDVHRYKDTNDYFITFTVYSEDAEVSDKYNSEFYTRMTYNYVLKQTTITYYASIPEFDSDYFVVIDGKEIKLQDSFFSN